MQDFILRSVRSSARLHQHEFIDWPGECLEGSDRRGARQPPDERNVRLKGPRFELKLSGRQARTQSVAEDFELRRQLGGEAEHAGPAPAFETIQLQFKRRRDNIGRGSDDVVESSSRDATEKNQRDMKVFCGNLSPARARHDRGRALLDCLPERLGRPQREEQASGCLVRGHAYRWRCSSRPVNAKATAWRRTASRSP